MLISDVLLKVKCHEANLFDHASEVFWQLLERQSFFLHRQHTWLRSHALEVTQENHKTIELEYSEVDQPLDVTVLNFLPDPHSDEPELNQDHDEVRKDCAASSAIFSY